MSALFVRKYGILFEFPPKLSFQGGSVYVNDDNIEFNPQAMKENIPEEFTSMFDFAQLVLSKDFVDVLYSGEMYQKGSVAVYKNNEYTITIDLSKGMFKEFEKKDSFKLKFNSYKSFNNVARIPSNVLFTAEKTKFKCVCELNKSSNISSPDLKKISGINNNDSTSSGQD